MKKKTIITLKILRKLYCKCFGGFKLTPLQREENPNIASDIIYKLLSDDKPCMIARFGSTELSAIVNYIGITSPKHSVWNFIKGKQPEWWWNKNIMLQMKQWSGFFPPTEKNLSTFCRLMLDDCKQIDLLGSWILNEFHLRKLLVDKKKVHLRLIEPFWSDKPWSRILEGKKILVVHPFAPLIAQQYKNRHLLFEKPEILPDFKLITLQAVQSLNGESQDFDTWFDALEWMEDEIDKVNYDICLIGCGAYGFPLAAHVKRQGKKAIHLGGALQLLFGIRGKRWENPEYGVKEWGISYGSYSNMMNDYWVSPGDELKPESAKNVEGACYW